MLFLLEKYLIKWFNYTFFYLKWLKLFERYLTFTIITTINDFDYQFFRTILATKSNKYLLM